IRRLELRKKQRLVHDRNQSARGSVFEQHFDGAPPFGSEIDRVLVHVQVDVAVHDVVTLLLGVFAHEWMAGLAVIERVFYAPPPARSEISRGPHFLPHALPAPSSTSPPRQNPNA